MNLKNFNLLMMYYEYENTQKHEKKGKISIQKKGSKVEIINIGSINDSNNSTISFSNEIENQFINDNIDNNLNDDNFLDLNDEINICSYDGTFHHFNCLCYFMFENLFDLKQSFFNINNNLWDNFIQNIQKYFAEYKKKKD